ncbi:TetR/AcrR family transcriptional regulator [Nocardia sp. NPDC024068]|uniref:TetR/AcrR family transcriptional regulator n=1 Tax=Nocardia sp. NPDC024068 TaxID=3157197 RepID=UPI00340D248B
MTTRPRRPGRPTSTEAAELVERLREAAVQTFLERGYDGATMEAIARAAGVTKQTLYARYPDKRAVFAEVIPWAMSRRDPQAQIVTPPDADLGTSLLALAREALARISDPQLAKLQRIAMHEASRFPEFAVSAETVAWSPRLRAVRDLLRSHREAGHIELAADDIELAAEHFLVLVESEPWRMAEFGVYRTPEQTERHLRFAVTLFLRALQPRPGGGTSSGIPWAVAGSVTDKESSS